MTNEVLPGATVGILGNGITSRYLAQVAHNQGFLVAGFSQRTTAPILQEADYQFTSPDDFDNFLGLTDVITYTSSWLPAEVIDSLQGAYLPQGTDLISYTDDHALSRAFCEEHALNILPYTIGVSLDDVAKATEELGFPVVVKPIFKHQHHDDTVILRGIWDLGKVAPLIDGGSIIIESWLDDTREFSLTAVKGSADQLVYYPLQETRRLDHYVRAAFTPQDVPQDVLTEMYAITERMGKLLTYQGAFQLNFFYSQQGNLYVRDLTAGIPDTDILYNATASLSVMENHFRAITGQALQAVKKEQVAVYLPVLASQKQALLWHWHMQSQWQIALYNTSLGGQIGHVLARGEDIDRLFNQLQVANVWPKLN